MPATTPLVQAPLDRLRYLQELQRRSAQIKRGVARYYDDPLGFAADCIDWRGGGLKEYQQEIIGELPSRKREAVRGPHTLGKSTIAAVAVLWFGLTRDAAGVDWKVATTAGSWHQLTRYLWPEIHKWSGRLRWDKVRDGRPFTRQELQNLNLRLSHGAAFAGASANAALIEGAHADSLMFIYDESKAIPAGTFDACEGAFGGTGEALALALSTPGTPAGRFYDICTRRAGYEDWHPVHVTLERAIAAGQVDEAWADQRARQWGTQSAIYVNRVLGEFHAGDEDSVIPLAWAEAAVIRWLEWDLAGRPGTESAWPRTVGVDVARSGSDKTVLAPRRGPVIIDLRRSVKEDTMQTTGRVKGVLDADRGRTTPVVDVIGIGAGVVDRLREQEYRVEAFNASARSDRLDATGELGFINCLTGDARVTPVGNLRRIYRSRHEGPLLQVETASGDHFTATPNHQVLTLRGWVAVQSLRVGDKLCDASVRNAPDAAAVRPEVDDVPPKLSEVYRAADVVFGSERVQRGTVDFHGDRPAGEVDVVTIDRRLLARYPSSGQCAEHHQFIRLLILAGQLPRPGALAHAVGVRDRIGRIAASLPDGRMPCPALPSLGEGEPVEDEIVRLGDRSRRDAMVTQDAVDNPFRVTVGERQRLGRFPLHVAPDDLRLVKVNRAGEAHGLGVHAGRDLGFAQDAANRVRVNSERLGQRVHRLADRVAGDEGCGIDIRGGREPGGLGLAAWLDSVYVKNLADGAPVGPVELGQRVKGLAGEIALDEVIRVELTAPALGHEAPFVYTLETSTGSYGTANVVHRNCRSAAWWGLREMLDPSSGSEVCLPDDDMLLGDLSAPQWKVLSGGKIQVESKEEITRRLGRSTDDGDAVVQAFWLTSAPHQANARQYALQAELDALTRPADPRRRLAGDPSRHDGRRDDGWSLDSFAPQEDAGRPARPNVHSWR